LESSFHSTVTNLQNVTTHVALGERLQFDASLGGSRAQKSAVSLEVKGL